MTTIEEAKKNRANKARVLTRRTNELLNGITTLLDKEDIEEKINTIKTCRDELGIIQDNVLSLTTDDDETTIEAEWRWYNGYDLKVNQALKEARDYLKNQFPTKPTENEKKKDYVKVKRLEIPKFQSDSKRFYKWKDIFDRYMKEFDDTVRYDYLLSSTEGEARRYVENRDSYKDAMGKLEEKYGNKHIITGLLIDEIRAISVVRWGDFGAFENLSIKVNEFHDRMKLMGMHADAENSYILKEIESKLNYDDHQKWLESKKDEVDTRTVTDLVNWMEHQTHLRRITHSSRNRNNSSFGNRDRNQNDRRNFNSMNSSISLNKCPKCTAEHGLAECPIFVNLNLNNRWDCAKSLRACFICLKTDHRRIDCTSSLCDVCNGPHHASLHNYAGRRPNEVVTTTATISVHRSLLPIVKVTVCCNGLESKYTTLLDTGSEVNIMSLKCFNQLHLSGERIRINMVGVGGVRKWVNARKVNVNVKDNTGKEFGIEFIVLNQVCGRVLGIDRTIVESCGNELMKQKQIISHSGDIDLIIGMGYPEIHEHLSREKLPNGLVIIETRFGNCLVGPVQKESTSNYEPGVYHANSICVPGHTSESCIFRDQLQAELAGVMPSIRSKNEEEVQFEEKLKFSTDSENRFYVDLPWKYDPNKFANNREQAVERDLKLMKQLRKNPKNFGMFMEQINEMITMGVLKMVEEKYPKRYLPLLAITDLSRESTRVRICLDAKCKFKGHSFNDYLLKGKLEMPDALTILTIFRSGKYAMQGDLSKMFWQIRLSEKDQQYHGIMCNGQTMVFTRVSFGGKPSPPIADGSMLKIAAWGRKDYPLGSEILENKRYVDDLFDSSSQTNIITEKRDQTTDLLGHFGFEVKGWISNESSVGEVKEDGKVLGIRWNALRDQISVNLSEYKNITKITKRGLLSIIASVWDPLGILVGVMITGRLLFQSMVRRTVRWDEVIHDTEMIKSCHAWLLELSKCKDIILPRSNLPDEEFPKGTKCDIVGFSDGSSVAHGAVLYIRWYNQDETKINVKFLAAKAKVNQIKGLTIPRAELSGAFLLSRLGHTMEKALEKTELKEKLGEKAFFTDSTTVLSWIRSSFVKDQFILGKISDIQASHPVNSWRFISSKNNTAADLISRGCRAKDLEKVIRGPDMLYLPRNEWAKEAVDIITEPTDHIAINIAVQSDSKNDSIIDLKRFKSWRKLLRVTAYMFRFASKRVKKKVTREESQDGMEKKKVTREKSLDEMEKEVTREESQDEMEKKKVTREESQDEREKKEVTREESLDEMEKEVTREESQDEMKKKKVTREESQDEREKKEVTREECQDERMGVNGDEIDKASKYWIRLAQRDLDMTSRNLEKLSPFIDDEGVARIHGRLTNIAVFDEARKHPVLLPKNHLISDLIVQDKHNDCLHSGHLRVMAEVRKEFWIVNVRCLAKRIGRSCVTCRRWRGKAIEQRMADLPSFRLKPGHPFETTAVDYFGPFMIKYGYRKSKKAYGAVFTCTTTRAVHLELATEITTESFMLALRRFISMYGAPKKIISDNGTNFVGAANEIKNMIKSWRVDAIKKGKINDLCASELIEWKFNTPRASHHNGVVEIMVKTVKSSLNKVVKDRVLSEEEYRTILAEVTSCINSRPLWVSSDGDVEQCPITCNDLLRPGGLPRDPISLNTNCHPRKRYDQIQRIVDDWWRLWLLHFAPNLQSRNKWFKKRENVCKGDVVLMIDAETPRSTWSLAVVDETFAGKDGLVRSAKVRCKSGTYNRPITKLCMLISRNELLEEGTIQSA